MRRQFTAAAQRVLAEAACWTSGPDDAWIDAPALLLGLLAESECRAAITLSRCGITAEAVLQRWPTLVRVDATPANESKDSGGASVSMRPAVPVPGPDVDIALGKAIRRLKAFYTPHELATEHILLGLACLEDESGQWLHDRGVQTDALEEEIRTLHFGSYVHDSPLPFVEGDEEEEAIALDGGEAIEVEEERGLTDEKEVESTLGSPHPSPLPAGEGTGVEQSELLDSQRVLRVIDAAANRAREGLRVAEDYVRFFLDDRHLTQAIKELRHELTAALRPFPLNERLGARDTQQDVGTDLDTPGERQRDGSGDVIAANFTRVQESLRSLEEFTKTTKSEASARFKQLRYRSYTLQRAVETTGTSCRRLHGARLYVLLDGRPTLEEFCRLAKELVAAGVHVVQLRDKTLDDRQLIQRARSLREITAAGKTLMIVNDRPDLAVLSQADGVHVGQEELSVKDARTIVGPRRLVGVSTHSIEQARRAVLDGASYIGVGPTFPSGTKAFPEFPGPTLLRLVAEEIGLPAFAIGGIDSENLPQVLATGIGRVAVSGAVTKAPNPAAAVRALSKQLS